ncbi:hypothetical protein [Methylobacterium isbiliense]|jgi:hypothetical protein|uniref:Uncharacterized protein n=1 Tax=Methylobacterium isbiliense TaxID=315478 RepID=A0ABQ4SA23_9HYPH|nr:hypothetical protein [Methylobacterium isbiliense]MDN3625734.1 hypothetical protein [Methylobacterium isbiliense]GJD98714.1 hypothetical protein GMJLKIPL_0625 [Methylobacterium isbiliense]
MFDLPPDDPANGDLQPLSVAIDTLCEALEGDRKVVIEGLAEIIRKRAEFERCRQVHGHVWRLRLIVP